MEAEGSGERVATKTLADVDQQLMEPSAKMSVGNVEDANQASSNTQSQTVNGTENGSVSGNEHDGDDDENMPDLLWPDKSNSANKTMNNNGEEMTSSISQDTGFGSQATSEQPSPDENALSMEQSLDGQVESNDTNSSEPAPEAEGEMDILGNGLLKKKVLVPGKGVNTRPTSGDIVTLRVEGKLEDGTIVDSGEVSFILNDGDVILAFDLAVSLMEADEKCELFTSPRYAFGSLGRDPDIPKDANLTYTLELLNIQPSQDISSMSYDERLKMGEAKRERGNYLFGRTDYSGAINSYTKAVKVLDDTDLNAGLDEASRALLTESWVKCYNNMAACQLKIDALDAAIRSCEKVLVVQENNVKALFRLGKAYGAKGDVDQAIPFLRRAIKLDPQSKMVQQELLNLSRRKSKETETEKELYQRMLGVKPGDKSSKEKSNSSQGLMKWALLAGGVAAALVSVGLSWYRTS